MAAKKKTASPISEKPATSQKEIKDQICALISEGVSLREICRKEWAPSWRAVYDWINADADFASRFARAREIGADAIAIEAMEIMDAEPERDMATGKYDPASVAWQKSRAELRLKLLAKWSPKLYGDRITADHTSSDGSMKPVDNTAAVLAALARKHADT